MVWEGAGRAGGLSQARRGRISGVGGRGMGRVAWLASAGRRDPAESGGIRRNPAGARLSSSSAASEGAWGRVTRTHFGRGRARYGQGSLARVGRAAGRGGIRRHAAVARLTLERGRGGGPTPLDSTLQDCQGIPLRTGPLHTGPFLDAP